MISDRPIEKYLSRLERQLRASGLPSRRLERILIEIREHLIESARALRTQAASDQVAENQAVSRFDRAGDLGDRFIDCELDRAPLLRAANCALTALSLTGALLVAGFALWAPVPREPAGVTAFKVALAAGVGIQGFLTLWQMMGGSLARLTTRLGACGLFVFGIVVTSQASFQAWHGPDPEYWVIMLGAFMACQGLLTVWLLRPRTLVSSSP